MGFLDRLFGRGKKTEKEKRAHSMLVRHKQGPTDIPKPDETLKLRTECYKCDYWCEYEIGASWREKYDKKEPQWFLARGHIYLKSCGDCGTIYCEDHCGDPKLYICPRCGSRLSRDAMWELLVSGRYKKFSSYMIEGIRVVGINEKEEWIYEIYNSDSRTTALQFLRAIPQSEIPPLYYIIVETPVGNIGKDLNVIFDESTGNSID